MSLASSRRPGPSSTDSDDEDDNVPLASLVARRPSAAAPHSLSGQRPAAGSGSSPLGTSAAIASAAAAFNMTQSMQHLSQAASASAPGPRHGPSYSPATNVATTTPRSLSSNSIAGSPSSGGSTPGLSVGPMACPAAATPRRAASVLAAAPATPSQPVTHTAPAKVASLEDGSNSEEDVPELESSREGEMAPRAAAGVPSDSLATSLMPPDSLPLHWVVSSRTSD